MPCAGTSAIPMLGCCQCTETANYLIQSHDALMEFGAFTESGFGPPWYLRKRIRTVSLQDPVDEWHQLLIEYDPLKGGSASGLVAYQQTQSASWPGFYPGTIRKTECGGPFTPVIDLGFSGNPTVYFQQTITLEMPYSDEQLTGVFLQLMTVREVYRQNWQRNAVTGACVGRATNSRWVDGAIVTGNTFAAEIAAHCRPPTIPNSRPPQPQPPFWATTDGTASMLAGQLYGTAGSVALNWGCPDGGMEIIVYRQARKSYIWADRTVYLHQFHALPEPGGFIPIGQGGGVQRPTCDTNNAGCRQIIADNPIPQNLGCLLPGWSAYAEIDLDPRRTYNSSLYNNGTFFGLSPCVQCPVVPPP